MDRWRVSLFGDRLHVIVDGDAQVGVAAARRSGSRARASASSRRGSRTSRSRTSSSASSSRAAGRGRRRRACHAPHRGPGAQGADPAGARSARAGAGARPAGGPHRAHRHVDLAHGARPADRRAGPRPDAAVPPVRGRIPHLADVPRRDAAADDVARARADTAAGRARALIIPTHFGREIWRGRGAPRCRCWWTAPTATPRALIRGNAAPLTRAFAQAGRGRRRPAPMIQTATRLWFNPAATPRKFYGPGIFVLALSMFPDRARHARDVARGRAADDSAGVRLEHLRARVPARQDPRLHGRRAGAVRCCWSS